jgi:DNA-directed RNA polymerase subunit beta'
LWNTSRTSVSPLKKNEEIVEKLSERIVGRVSLQDVIQSTNWRCFVEAGERISDEHAKAIEDSPIESVEVRSPLNM